jgi:catechol 2,3-dioxygenase-like lactoylglutathione lyase family enzyme
LTPIWYHVHDLDAGREFYTRKLGFIETYLDGEGRWATLERNGAEIGIAEGSPTPRRAGSRTSTSPT